MSALHKSKPCKSDASYCRFGNETLSKLLQAFKAQIGGVIESEDIEYVHKMRVVSRRIRAALPLFHSCYPKKEFKKWLREVKNVTRLLGEARDLDVQIAFVQTYLQKLNPDEAASLEPLLRMHKIRRNAIQATVTIGLEELQASRALEEMAESFMSIEEPASAPFDPFSVLEKAYWHISSRMDEFLAFEGCVHDETANLKQHEMRIKAKWLRYTMEVFAPLYKKRLTEEIRTIKDFQDVLGEMHDCNVWIDFLPKFVAKLKTETSRKKKNRKTAIRAKNEQAILNFLKYVKDAKATHYNHFVELWDEKIADHFFEKLREIANAGVTLGTERIAQALSNQNVKIAIFADIHANLNALETVIQDAEKRGAEVFLNAGDSVGFGAYPNEVIRLLHSKNIVSVMGNFDLEVTQKDTANKGAKKKAVDFTRKELAKSCESYLLSFPSQISFDAAGTKLLLVHGSPESIDEHIYHDTPDSRLEEFAEDSDADVIIVGHSHEQFQRQVNRVNFINPGSVGRPGDGNPQAAYAILTLSPLQVDLIRLDYDNEAAAEALRQKKFPECFAQMLLRGLPLDTIIEEDKAKKDVMLQNCKEITEASQRISATYLGNTEHSRQVTKLALTFFDSLSQVHKFGKRERCWLENAAILHDIGLSDGTTRHHKRSMEIILNDTQFPFTSEERRIVACIARYHRKGLPKPKQYNLASLNQAKVKKIMLLSGLLRVADALDYSHQSVVKTLNFQITPKRVTAQYTAAQESLLEEQAFKKKKDLFEKVFQKKLVLTWIPQ